MYRGYIQSAPEVVEDARKWERTDGRSLLEPPLFSSRDDDDRSNDEPIFQILAPLFAPETGDAAGGGCGGGERCIVISSRALPTSTTLAFDRVSGDGEGAAGEAAAYGAAGWAGGVEVIGDGMEEAEGAPDMICPGTSTSTTRLGHSVVALGSSTP